MAMSWGWTPLCQIGNRYRITSTTTEQLPPPSSVSVPSTQCTITSLPQLPPETSVIITPQSPAVSCSLPVAPVARPPISSLVNGPLATSQQTPTTSAEERVVRRSPRLASATKVSYREEAEANERRRQNQESSRAQNQQMVWNANTGQNNVSQQPPRPDYSVYNYDGQVINSTSISVIYNNKNNSNNVTQFRYPTAAPFIRPPVLPVSSLKKIARKVTIKSLDFYEVVNKLVQSDIIPEGVGESCI